nr:MAG TPA: hypothetical protein [Caudoviricetes sp.]
MPEGLLTSLPGRGQPETKHTEIPINPTRAGIKRARAYMHSYFLLFRVRIRV